MRLALVIPTADPPTAVEECLRALAPLRARGHRLILVHGGSLAAASACDRSLADRIVQAPRGWSFQANAGARTAEAETADALVFVPGSVRLPDDADRAIARALDRGASPWGFFAWGAGEPRAGAATPPGGGLALRLAAALADTAARLSRSALAEQSIFATRAAFEALEGFDCDEDPPDIGFCRRARLLGAPIRLPLRVAVPATVRGAAATLGEAVQREAWRLACAWDLPWRPQPPSCPVPRR